MPNLRLTYAATIPFTVRAHIVLCLFYVFGFVGLLIWNFLSSAKGLQCTSYASQTYNADTCSATPLEFASTYYTRPISPNAERGSIGTFPWTPFGFGTGNNGPIDYTVLNLNWTADPLKCVMYEQYLSLHLDSEGAIINSCYYCGPDLRVLCTMVDSERTQVPDRSVSDFVGILDGFAELSRLAHAVVATVQSGAIVGSVRMNTQRVVQGLDAGVMPYSTNKFDIDVGSTIGPIAINAENANAGVRNLAVYAQTLSNMVEQATTLDLQPADASNADNARTLQVSYLCRTCKKDYKPTLEIIALLITGVFGVLSPAFAGAKMIAEWFSDAPQPLDPKDPTNIVTGAGAGAAVGAAAGGAASNHTSMYKPDAAQTPGLAPPMQQANSYSMLPTQPYSPQPQTPGVVGAPAGAYPSYPQPYGQA